MKRTRILFFICCIFNILTIYAQNRIKSLVLEESTNQPVIGATVMLEDSKRVLAVTDENGQFYAENIQGKTIRISYIGYKPLIVKAKRNATYYLVGDTSALAEVVVTAQESQGLVTASTIGKQAMEHLQPSSFTDLLELLPGGRSLDPNLSVPNCIRLREAMPYGSVNYSTSSLGTSFVLDGAPISNNADKQYISGAWEPQVTNRTFINKGVDMRAISTDDIEKVEVVRGIPSVEYGDLTSGLIKIERRHGGHDTNARLKSDMSSKLFYLAKGFELGKLWTLNLSADYLKANNDPRNTLEGYSRVTFSLRSDVKWRKESYNIRWANNLDYSGSFDGEKLDPDLNKGKRDIYKSSYNRFAFNSSLNLILQKKFWLKSVNAVVSTSYQHNFTSRLRLVQLLRMMPALSTTTEGDHTVSILPYTYYGQHDVDGKPLNVFGKVNVHLQIPLYRISNNLLLGSDFSLDKNYGRGQEFNPLAPLYTGTSVRPHKLSLIPAMSMIAFYGEEKLQIPIARNIFFLEGGVRISQMLNLSRVYTMHGQWYADPRINIGWLFPQINIGKRTVNIRLHGGVGQHTKFPTMDYIYPDKNYLDIIQLSYYHPKEYLRTINVRTFVLDVTNKNIHPACNLKWEMGTDISFAGNKLSVIFFHEDMKDGFRPNIIYRPYRFKQFNTSMIDGKNITAPPDVNNLPYTMEQELLGSTEYSNGSRTLKKGLEYTFSTRRIPSLYTRLTINGAWFKTIYTNSQLVAYRPSEVINGKQIQYVGLYRDNDGLKTEMANTNFTFDTNIPKLRLGFSLSAQCLWFTSSQRLPLSNEPERYIDSDGTLHEWKTEDKDNVFLYYLIRNHSEKEYIKYTVPFSMNLNLKVTKKLLNDRLNIAMFCNRMLDYTPDYKQDKITIRRSVRPYFGLEVNLKL